MIALLAFLWACPATVPVSPAEVVDAQARALRAGDLARASSLLALSARRRGLGWPSSLSVPQAQAVETERRARWRTTRLSLVRRGKGWKLIGLQALRQLFVASSPERALRIFAHGVIHGHYGLLVRMMPASERPHWTGVRLRHALQDPKVSAVWRRLAQKVGAKEYRIRWTVKGKLCVVRIPSLKAEMVLRLEAKGWKILDVRPARTYSPAPR